MEHKNINLSDYKVDIKDNSSYVSANVLCKYMKKMDYLQDVLKNKALKPRYGDEWLDYFNISELECITFPMICFCDIPLSKIKKHTNIYGEYGIALKKEACVNWNVQPITYININSSYFSDFRDTLKKLYTSEPIDPKWEILADNVLTQLLYSKPIKGKMFLDETFSQVYFKDECEWRYIPKLNNGMELILSSNHNSSKGREIYNKALASRDNAPLWLRYEVDDVKYIIVPTEDKALELINYITHSLNKMYNRNERRKLISKIEIIENIESDFV